MARPLRIELSGGLYHVTSRGDRREDIYFSKADREDWLALFARVCARFNWICHAYCLMTNHYHLVIETPEGNLANGMRQLNGDYAMKAIADAFDVHYTTVRSSQICHRTPCRVSLTSRSNGMRQKRRTP
jgi:REP element-mobilizing transposase RayT